MERITETKTPTLIITTIVLCLAIIQGSFGLPQLSAVAISKGCTVLARLTYSFFHASFLHALINGWCLLSIVFLFDVPRWQLVIAYLTAVTFPIDTIGSTEPTVGSSAFIFALLGMVSFQTKRKVVYHATILAFIALGFILPYLIVGFGLQTARPNNILHLYCYVVGLIVGFLDSPMPCRK